MDRVQEESRVAVGTLAWCGYLLMAAPVAASWCGGADEPGAALLAFGLLLLGLGFISLAMLAPGPAERAQQEEGNRAVANGDNKDNHQGREVPDAPSLTWCGYLLVAAAVVAAWFGLADEPGAALLAYALLLLGVGFIGLAMLAPAKLKTL